MQKIYPKYFDILGYIAYICIVIKFVTLQMYEKYVFVERIKLIKNSQYEQNDRKRLSDFQDVI